jgi:hypothetical protein
MKQTIEDIEINLELEKSGVRVISGGSNVILPNQDLRNVFAIIENNYKFLSNYYTDISSSKIEAIDIKLICIKIVLHYLYMYNMWRQIYENEKDRDLKFIKEDLFHPQTYDIIFDYFKLKHPNNWIDKSSIMMKMSIDECLKIYTARELFLNR